jgi:cytochrome P450
MRRLYQAHGLIAALEEQGRRVIFAFGPDYNRQLLSDPNTFHARFFAIRGPRNSAQRRLTSALLGMNGDEHKRHRRLVMGPFQKESISRYGDQLGTLAQRLIRRWRPGQVRDTFQDMAQHMLRVTSNVLFGYERPALAYEIGRRTHRWVTLNHELGVAALVSDERISWAYEDLLNAAQALEETIRAMIAHRRSAGTLGNDVLSLLLRAHEGAGAALSEAELIGQAAILFGAAHMTTANTLTWTLFLLAQHPRVAADLADELSGVLHGDSPTVPELDQLPLLDHVVKESMRILPASFYVQRVNTEPVDLGPFRVAPGTVIVFSQYMTHHMPDLFPEPERFRPERWQTITPSPYAYLPFGAGPRLCLGGPLALLTIKITLATILQHYHLHVVDGARIDGKVTATMLAPASGMPMIVSTRGSPLKSTAVEGNIHEMVCMEF